MAALKCSICSEMFSESRRIPKVLNCGHTFCLMCLSNPLVFKCFYCSALLLKGAKEYPTNLILLKQISLNENRSRSSSELSIILKDFRGQLLVNEQIIGQNIAEQQRLTSRISSVLAEAEVMLYMMEIGHVYNDAQINCKLSSIKDVLKSAAESCTVPSLPPSVIKNEISSVSLPPSTKIGNHVCPVPLPPYSGTGDQICHVSLLPSSATGDQICPVPLPPYTPTGDQICSVPLPPSKTAENQICSVPLPPSSGNKNQSHSVPMPPSSIYKIQINSTLLPSSSSANNSYIGSVPLPYSLSLRYLPPKKRHCLLKKALQIVSVQ